MELRMDRPITPLGELQYEETNERYSTQLSAILQNIDSLIADTHKDKVIELSQINPCIQNIEKHFERYEKCIGEYEAFLVNYRTTESASAAQILRHSWKSVSDKVKSFISELHSKLPQTKLNSHLSKHSHHSRSSRSSRSSVSSVLLKQTAKVEEAKARLKYAAEEAELIKKEAEIKASLSILKSKRDLEEAETGLGAIKQVLDFSERSEASENNEGSNKPPSNKSQEAGNFLTQRYVAENAHDTSPPELHNDMNNIKPAPSNPPEVTNVLRPQAPPFYPSQQNEASTLAMLVTKQQLLPKRLSHFNDKPERYLSWKYSFLNVMDETKATTMEQLDLLLNHLGPESKSQADNIRASNPRDPQKALVDIWERLDREYGSAENIESALKCRIANFPSLNDSDRKRFFDISDLAAEVASIKCDPVFAPTFAYYDTSGGINDFVRKLPWRLREKWASNCDHYKVTNNVPHAPFSVFTKFLRDVARVKNDPSFAFETSVGNQKVVQNKPNNPARNLTKFTGRQGDISVRKTGFEQSESDVQCPIHGEGSNHELRECRKFRAKSFKERKEYLFKNGYCLRCCYSKRHPRKNCKEIIKCHVCGSTDHVTILHPEPRKGHEGEQSQGTEIKSSCTEVCNSLQNTSKSCAKIVLVKVFHENRPSKIRDVYCMIDDQSNRSLATSTFFNEFGEYGPETEYILSSCAGKFTTSGRKATGYLVQSNDNSCTLKLPCLIECNDLPNNRNEIPTQSVALSFPHLYDIASYIPPMDNNINIEILIGRDLITAHHVMDQRLGHDGLPCGQKLPLGWVIIGEVCLDKVHQPEVVSIFRTSILTNGRPSYLPPCDSDFTVKEDPIFRRTSDDEKPGLSVEDNMFLSIMDTGFKRTTEGNWQAPLPFRTNRSVLPDNRPLALHRAKSFDVNLKCNPIKQKQVLDFMERLIGNGHAEPAPTIPTSLERWYLPMFAVYHPKKPDSVRIVFDSSARYQDISLNSVLLQGPDLCNSLLGILLRFRRERVAVTMDVEQMFHNFKVPDDDRRYLRFLWHHDNNIDSPLVDFQMTVHVFGNTTSPAVATYGFRKVVENADKDVKDLINNNFYVDDGLLSCSSEETAVDLVVRAKQALQVNGNIRLHKFASNSREVLNSFKQDDLAKNLKDLDLGSANLPVQRSLGLLWDTETDIFTFQVNRVEKPYTRRGLLSTINSVYDPIGFVQPVIVQGKLLLREMMSVTSNSDWDEPLPESLYNRWRSWVDSLSSLENLYLPRMFCDISFERSDKREVLVYSDASKEVIAAVAYLRLYNENSQDTSFLLGKAKVAPTHGHTIPRLELCSAVLATQIAETIQKQLDIPSVNFNFFSDSKVVLGYIANESRRFYIYVGNRIARIRLFSKPSQLHYVSTECNPADVATRNLDVAKLGKSKWILGPTDQYVTKSDSSFHVLVEPDSDSEIRPEVRTNKMDCYVHFSWIDIFSRFSDWNRLVRVIALVKFCAYRFTADNNNSYSGPYDPNFLRKTELFIISVVQQDSYEEIQDLKHGKFIPKNSCIKALDPYLHSDGVIRVGGRFNKASDSVIATNEKHPIILPKNHHVSRLILRHFHCKVLHQGRKFTEGALRSAGYWLVGSKRMVSSEISKCVLCRKLRGTPQWQHMDDLPEDRCKASPPFSYVGVDTFGPWPVTFRRTRGGSANHKRWALLFTCLVTRAIHIEVIEELSSSAFINALRRFVSIRGPVIQYRSDRGTNFVGAVDDLSIDSEFVEKGPIAKYLSDSRTIWKFNPPHAPHMGGAWERLIGIAKRILTAMLLQNKGKDLTHDVLTTLMAEVCAIINNRPLTDVSSDPESPNVLSPSMLLTFKTKQDVNQFPLFNSKDAFKSAWKQVQVLADEFWQKWRSEYLHNLQVRGKWQGRSRDLKSGDLVLMKYDECLRNEWPTGVIEKTFPSPDGHVRKVEVAIIKDSKRVVFTRPVTELVLLLEAD